MWYLLTSMQSAKKSSSETRTQASEAALTLQEIISFILI